AQLFLLPVKVQGKGAAEEIAEAIEFFNQHNLVDVLLIGRGGGSLEDLWAFNEEIVVRAVANSALPVVSAVGHEVDVSLSDLAADVRSPTPTASASLIVPKLSDLLKFLNDYKRSYLSSIENSIILWQERIQSIERGYGFKRVYAIVNEERQRLDSISDKLESSLVRKYDSCCEKLQSIHHRISDLSPQAVLNRGFCIARRQDKWIVKESSQIKPGEEVKLNFSKGSSAAYILEVWSNG
ncbi:exodeoxyribonuclease VII large subunit, partial [bacterium]|nr:exodeoxyribonuclease VII large subunit [bacterium]